MRLKLGALVVGRATCAADNETIDGAVVESALAENKKARNLRASV
ncbi:hypothetical protein [Pseudomonas sp. CGJS7]